MVTNVLKVCCLVFLLLGCNNHCKLIKEEKNRKIGGVIEEKFVREWSHGERILAIQNTYDNDQGIYLAGDKSDFFDYVQVGDSIFKESNSLKIQVFREGVLKKIFALNFYGNCEL